VRERPTGNCSALSIADFLSTLPRIAMDYHVARNNEKLGVYPEADLRTRLQTGEVLPSDLVWCEGMSAWRPAGEVFPGAGVPSAPPPMVSAVPPPPPARPFSPIARPPKPDNCLVWAILATLFCCIPLGIVAIVFATQVDSKYAAGDYAGAQVAAGRAKLWSIIAACSIVVGAVLYLVMMVFLGGVMGVLGSMPQ
jgi:hypothetical protein